ncbi:uncharacterized protein LOC135689803 isoform X2 [Rhopilema esculentum]|uniref:uncharacterized protein LOC135689803 isoform X2 n=1 Tax=Rhopilema esculentum TaxID=499914 RepID=UPI0031D5BD5D
MSSSTVIAKDPGRLFEENIILKQKIGKVKRSIEDMSIFDVDGQDGAGRDSNWKMHAKRWILRPITVFGVLGIVLAIVVVSLLVSNFSATRSSLREAVAANVKASALKTQNNKGLTTCTDAATAKTFPDLDYALFGYNILKGYPMAIGHDPGLTRPIFDSDYSKGKRTADCRYHLPDGLIVVPDISCVTSFTSEIIQDQYQLTRSLAASAEVSGGGWGAVFSASAEYRKNSAEVGSKETVYVNSQAKCDYYISMIDEMQPPPLSKSFLMKAALLKKKSDVFDFFDYYGTHYLKQVTFGARLIYENKMTKSKYKELEQSSISVSMSASYSGIVRVAGSASLSEKEARQAKEFRSRVETSTISVGAPPPPNGSTSQWASEVKDNPVPTKYKMAGIEELFTKKYMEGQDASERAKNDESDPDKCKEKCRQDKKCIAYTFSKPVSKPECKLYQQQAITEGSIKFKVGSFLEFYTNKTMV